ncbi:MAG TPA: hypothetical protein HPP59_02340 [Deltaproteobacteria bacterium]|nr:hypothetical protein [Deltaproteobacteria bacterium]
MSLPHRKNCFSLLRQNGYPFLCLLSGLLAAQIIATAQVYLSNADLHDGLKLIRSAGYLTIPNQHIMNRLQEFGPAFYGGLFFTLSLGASLSMLALGISWIWIRIFSAKRWFLSVLLIPWALFLLLINLHGFSPFSSAYILLVPIIVFRTAWKLMPGAPPRRRWAFKVIHPLLIILLTLLWALQTEGNLFMSLRDNLLLTSTPGEKLNDFYYRYTFYPAEVFKTLNQKTLKTCRITVSENADMKEALEKKLLENDYLPVENTAQVDLTLLKEGDEILLQQHGKTVVKTTIPDFPAMGAIRLKEFSRKTDRYGSFRKCVFFSLFTGLPAMGYLFLYLLIRTFSGTFLKPEASSVMAPILCFCVGVILLITVTPPNLKGMPDKTLNEMLESRNGRERITALKRVLGKRVEISDYRAYEGILKSPHIADRYWLTKTLAYSHNPETLTDLLSLLDDPSPNVVSMAYWALGLRGDRSATGEILKRLPNSKDWYNQWYAYNALRNLGWTQTKQ